MDLESQAPSLKEHELAVSSGDGDLHFEELKHYLFDAAREENAHYRRAGAVFCEAGKIDPGRPYFYIKASGDQGWLFERSNSGWIMSRSEKIVDRDLFLRKGAAWDVITLYKLRGGRRLRVSTALASNDIISFSLYKKLMLNFLQTQMIGSESNED